MKSGIRIGSKGKHKAKGEQNIKVLLKLFQKGRLSLHADRED